METYEQLLDRAYSKIKVVGTGGERFEIPKAKGQIQGDKTAILNAKAIADYLRRPLEHLAKFLMKELASFGEIEGERITFKGKLNAGRVNEKIETYVHNFVLCPECKKPDTEIIAEHGIKFKHCLACGAKTPIRSKM